LPSICLSRPALVDYPPERLEAEVEEGSGASQAVMAGARETPGQAVAQMEFASRNETMAARGVQALDDGGAMARVRVARDHHL